MLDPDHPENRRRAQAAVRRSGNSRCWSTTASRWSRRLCIIEHLQAHHPGPEPLDPGRRARPPGSLPRPLLRPLCHGEYAGGRVRHHFDRKASRDPYRRAARRANVFTQPMTGWRRIWATALGRSASSSRWLTARRRRPCSTRTGSRRSGGPAEADRLSRPAARPSGRRASGRRRPALSCSISRSARPTATSGVTNRQPGAYGR